MSVTEIKKASHPRETGSGMLRFNAIRPGTNAAYTLLFILLAVLCVIPVIFVIIISFSSEASIGKVGYSFVPAEWSTDAYDYVWHLRNIRGVPTIILAFLTSIGLTLVGTLIGLTLISTMGYVLSRRNFKLRGLYTTLIFIPMIFNGGLLSTYVVNVQLLGMKNTYWALIFPLACSSFYVIIMRTFFQTTIPDEIIESGKMDGASQLRIFVQLVLPISLPALATIALFLTFAYWNDWYQASLYIESNMHDMFPLQYVLVNIEKNIQYLANNDMAMSANTNVLPSETMRMAIVVIAVVPIMFSYPFFQKYFISGLTIGAVKG
ncbi:MAG: carbohydrate ABC transporter permease [Clostridia bacterium]|nr:carbohydrate ABC transporter permease [Clostridia bacterium]